jgi:hypothetical protein
VVPVVYTKIEEYRLCIPVLFGKVSELVGIKKKKVVEAIPEEFGMSK